MNSIYLTPELKSYYMKDFSNLLTNASGFWSIDSPIKDALISINTNPNIQTLYSKYPSLNSFASHESYLEFAYSPEVELTLFRRVVSYFTIRYGKHGFIFSFEEPSDNSNVNGKEKTIEVGARDDNNYFRINSLKFEIDSLDMNVHKDFWADLNKELLSLA